MEDNKIENNEGINETDGIKATDIPVVEEPVGTGKKVLKWAIRGLVLVATAISGFFLGRATSGHDDESEETTEETAE